jgi:hypothetical protein
MLSPENFVFRLPWLYRPIAPECIRGLWFNEPGQTWVSTVEGSQCGKYFLEKRVVSEQGVYRLTLRLCAELIDKVEKFDRILNFIDKDHLWAQKAIEV